MRMGPALILGLVVSLGLGTGTAVAQQGTCDGRQAPIVMSTKAGTLVVCGALPAIDSGGRLGAVVDVVASNEDAAELSSRLSDLAGVDVVVEPKSLESKVDFELRGVALWRALAALSSVTRVRVSGLDFAVLASIRTGLRDGHVSGSFHQAPLASVLDALSGLSGRRITTRPSDADKLVSYDFDNATLRDVLGELSRRTESRISLRKTSTGDRAK